MYDRQTAATAVNAMAEEGSGMVGEMNVGRLASRASAPPFLSQPAQTRGELASALDVQEKTTHELLEIVKLLSQRLQPVLAPSPEKDGAGGTDQCYGSPIANCVQQNTSRIRQATRVLAVLLHDLAI